MDFKLGLLERGKSSPLTDDAVSPRVRHPRKVFNEAAHQEKVQNGESLYSRILHVPFSETLKA